MDESPTPIAEIDHGPSKLDQFLDKHTSKLIIGAILIALAVVGYVIYSGLATAKAEEAGSALTSADTAEKYQEVINNWPDSKSAESAMLLLAGVQWEDQQSDSLETLRKFIDENPEHPALSTAKMSLGLKLLEQGNTDEATTLLTEVSDDEQASYIAPLARITLGDIAKSKGNTEEAISWYESASDDPTGQGNTFADTAESRLTLAKAAPPTKVAPVPPTPPSPPVPSPNTPGVIPSAIPTPPTLPPLEKPDTPVPSPTPADIPGNKPSDNPPEKKQPNAKPKGIDLRP